MEIIDKQHIENRLFDWRERIEYLYTKIENWLRNSSNYSFERSKPIKLREELMAKYGIEKIELPTANIYQGNTLLASLKPKGLWVIGANGRVDLISKSKLIMFLDHSEKFQPSNWKITDSKNKNNRLPLNKINLLNVLNSLQHEYH